MYGFLVCKGTELNRSARRRIVPLPSLAYKHRHDRISVRSDPKAPVPFSGLSRTPCPCHYQWVIPEFMTPRTKPDLNRNSPYQSSTSEQNRTALMADAHGLEPQSKVLETLMLTIAPSIHVSDFRYLTNRYIPGERLPRSHPPVNHNNTLLISTDFIHNKT